MQLVSENNNSQGDSSVYSTVELNSYWGDPRVCVCIWAECDPNKNLLSTTHCNNKKCL